MQFPLNQPPQNNFKRLWNKIWAPQMEFAVLSTNWNHYHFCKCLDIQISYETYNLLFKLSVYRKMQSKHVAVEIPTPLPSVRSNRVPMNSLLRFQWLYQRRSWPVFPTILKSLPSWFHSIHRQTSTIKKEMCVFLFLGSVQCLVLSSCHTAVLSWMTPVWLGCYFIESHWILLCCAN